MFASFDADTGMSTRQHCRRLFLFNAEQVFLNPVASPSLRLAVYAALASDDADTDVTRGRQGLHGPGRHRDLREHRRRRTDKSKVSYIVDPTDVDPAGGLRA